MTDSKGEGPNRAGADPQADAADERAEPAHTTVRRRAAKKPGASQYIEVDLEDEGEDIPGKPDGSLSVDIEGEGADESEAIPVELEDEAGGEQIPWFEGSVMIGTGSVTPPAPDGGKADRKLAAKPLPARPWLSDRGEMARGGMSAIHGVVDNNLRRGVAMKVLHPEIASQLVNRRRFVEEAQITGQLDHPNIPPIYDLWVSDSGEASFTMKWVAGETFKKILARRSPDNRSDEELESALRILLKVCDAVSFAHSRGVIHRDLKSDNIMVGTHGQVWVMDWGFALLPRRLRSAPRTTVSIARDFKNESLDPPNTAIGTVTYMAPEQALGKNDELDERTDVYLLGGILYEILTGFPPHHAKTTVEALRKAQKGAVQDPQEKLGEVKAPPDLCRIAKRALGFEPAARYQSVEELKDEIEWSLRNGFWFSSVTFPAGAIVFRENEPGDKAYIITKGSCEVFRTEQGERVSLRRMEKGDAFGEAAIFSGEPRSASVQVIEEMTTVVVTRESFERAMGGTSWMGFFVRALAKRFLELDERLSRIRQSDTR